MGCLGRRDELVRFRGNARTSVHARHVDQGLLGDVVIRSPT